MAHALDAGDAVLDGLGDLRLELGAGERVITEGDAPDGMYIVASGAVRIVHRPGAPDEVELARLGPGDVFGEIVVRHMGVTDAGPIFPGYQVRAEKFPGLFV